MLTDLVIFLYALALMPLLHKCENMEQNGLKALLIGILFTPISGFIYIRSQQKKNKPRKSEVR
jgi:hypothetical protein